MDEGAVGVSIKPSVTASLDRERSRNEQMRKLIIELRDYAFHKTKCDLTHGGDKCDCGLADILKRAVRWSL